MRRSQEEIEAAASIQPLVCLGEDDGTSASVMLAIWAQDFQLIHDTVHVVYYRFGIAGSVPTSLNHELMYAISRLDFGLRAYRWTAGAGR